MSKKRMMLVVLVEAFVFFVGFSFGKTHAVTKCEQIYQELYMLLNENDGPVDPAATS